MKEATFWSTSIGHIANQVLQRNRSFQVVGVTSRGIYLRPETDLMLFLTSDPYRGPLTLNIRGKSGPLPAARSGDTALRTGDRLNFGNSSQAVNIQCPLVWMPHKPPKYIRQPGNQFAEMLQRAGSILPDHPDFSLLAFAAIGSLDLFKEKPELADRIVSLYQSLGTGIPSETISGMRQVLGAGAGLTPLGDDLLIGILLVIRRSGKYRYRSGDEAAIYHGLLSAAQASTTALSWSLLHCAAQGSADERIIRVLDGLIAGRAIPDQDLRSLLAWGSSSGIGVLAGMLIGLSIGTGSL